MTYTRIERTNEGQWLEGRRRFITATDVARLAHGGAAARAAIHAEKEGQRTFRGNAYTEWGKQREPFIMAELEFEYGVTPNNALCVMDGTAWAATPDGIGGNRIGEAKTTGKPLDVIPPDHYDQMQWGMFVTGSGECAYGWEMREGSPGAFMPGQITHQLVARDDARIAELVKVADEFLNWSPGGEGEFGSLVAAYVEAKKLADEAAVVVNAAEQAIKDAVGDRDVSEAYSFASLSYVLPKPRKSFDQTAFKAAEPELFEQYVKETPPSKRTFRVTVKG